MNFIQIFLLMTLCGFFLPREKEKKPTSQRVKSVFEHDRSAIWLNTAAFITWNSSFKIFLFQMVFLNSFKIKLNWPCRWRITLAGQPSVKWKQVTFFSSCSLKDLKTINFSFFFVKLYSFLLSLCECVWECVCLPYYIYTTMHFS